MIWTVSDSYSTSSVASKVNDKAVSDVSDTWAYVDDAAVSGKVAGKYAMVC